jgi:hypothetical protein
MPRLYRVTVPIPSLRADPSDYIADHGTHYTLMRELAGPLPEDVRPALRPTERQPAEVAS